MVADGSCETRWIDDEVLESVFLGHISVATAERGRQAAFDLVGQRRPRFWIINLSGMEGYEADVRTPGFAWMKAFRERGGERLYIVTNQAVVRMMGAALAFATGMPIAFVATREHAARAIRE